MALVAGNWKMFKGPREAREFCRALKEAAPEDGAELVVCPPFVSLPVAVEALDGTRVSVFAQNVHWAAEGAYTGEVSTGMLREVGAAGAIVGHSERRQYFGETDETVARRAQAALQAGLRVIACVGESLVIAYEPVWAIGTGRVAAPGQIQESHAFIRSLLDVPVLYGGSVKPDNAVEVAGCRPVDGALVGGASLEVESFLAVCSAFRS